MAAAIRADAWGELADALRACGRHLSLAPAQVLIASIYRQTLDLAAHPDQASQFFVDHEAADAAITDLPEDDPTLEDAIENLRVAARAYRGAMH